MFHIPPNATTGNMSLDIDAKRKVTFDKLNPIASVTHVNDNNVEVDGEKYAILLASCANNFGGVVSVKPGNELLLIEEVFQKIIHAQTSKEIKEAVELIGYMEPRQVDKYRERILSDKDVIRSLHPKVAVSFYEKQGPKAADELWSWIKHEMYDSEQVITAFVQMPAHLGSVFLEKYYRALPIISAMEKISDAKLAKILEENLKMATVLLELVEPRKAKHIINQMEEQNIKSIRESINPYSYSLIFREESEISESTEALQTTSLTQLTAEVLGSDKRTLPMLATDICPVHTEALVLRESRPEKILNTLILMEEEKVIELMRRERYRAINAFLKQEVGYGRDGVSLVGAQMGVAVRFLEQMSPSRAALSLRLCEPRLAIAYLERMKPESVSNMLRGYSLARGILGIIISQLSPEDALAFLNILRSIHTECYSWLFKYIGGDEIAAILKVMNKDEIRDFIHSDTTLNSVIRASKSMTEADTKLFIDKIPGLLLRQSFRVLIETAKVDA